MKAARGGQIIQPAETSPDLLVRLEQLAARLGVSRDYRGVYRNLFDFLREASPATGIVVSLYDAAEQSRTCTYAASVGSRGVTEHEVGDLPVLPVNDSRSSLAIRSGEPVITADLQEQTDAPYVDVGDDVDVHVVRAAVAVPMKVLGETIGVFELQSYQKNAFRPEHLTGVTLAANLAAMATRYLQVLDREREQRRELARRKADVERLNRSLETRLRRLDGLHEIDQAIIDGPYRTGIFDRIARQIQQQLQVDVVGVFMIKPDSDGLQRLGGAGPVRSAAPATDDPADLVARALTARTLLFERQEAGSVQTGPAEKLGGAVDRWAVPLIVQGGLEGMLELSHPRPVDRDSEWHEYLNTLAAQTAIALNSRRLYLDLEHSNTSLVQAYDATIEGWAKALDLKDHETEGHSRRVTELTVRLAVEMGMSGNDLVHVRRGALLHDIGKMGVPDTILLKEGKLSDEEWHTMRSHTTHGFELLSSISFLHKAIDIPYCHHEKWDGSGYPRGLSGERIPLAARIFAVVDVYDALTSDRPYRPAWTREDAMTHIGEQAGKHFDPDVVAAFMKLMSRGGRP